MIVEKYFQTKCFEFYSKKSKPTSEKKASVIKLNLEQINQENENINENIINNKKVTNINIKSSILEEAKKENDSQKNAINIHTNKISDFKKINDPLSIKSKDDLCNQPMNEKEKTSLRTNLKLFFNDISKQHEQLNLDSNKEIEKLPETHIPVIRTKSFYNLKRSLTLQIDDEKETNFNNNEILEHKDLKNQFKFSDFFSRQRAGTSLTKRNSSEILDIRDLNNIIHYNNQEIYLIKADSSDEDEIEDDLKDTEENIKEKEISAEGFEVSIECKQDEQEEFEIRTRKRKNAAQILP